MKRLILAFLLLLAPSLALAQTYPITTSVSASPTCDTSAYATGELIGGKLTYTQALRKGTGYIVGVIVTDLSAQASDLEVVIFNANPTGTTFTDQAAFDIADADITKVAGSVLFGSSNRFAYADNGVKTSFSPPIPLVSATGDGTFYAALISRGTPTFAASTDVKVIFLLSQD